MATMISEVYELADYETRFTKFEGELLVLKWMVGFVIALDLAILARVYFS